MVLCITDGAGSVFLVQVQYDPDAVSGKVTNDLLQLGEIILRIFALYSRSNQSESCPGFYIEIKKSEYRKE